MVYLAVISFLAAILYFYVGLHAFKLNPKSELFQVFFFITLSMTIWSFGNGFLYIAGSNEEYFFWNKFGAFGWCSFEALVLYFVVVFTANKKRIHRAFKFIILLPAPVFLFMALFLFGPDIKTSPVIENIFYIGNFLYNFLYLAISILLLLLWGLKSKSRIQKRQARVIVMSSSIPFLLNLLTQEIMPFFGISLPNMGQIYTLIMLLGVYYAVTRYQFMSVPTSLISRELFNELTGLVFLVDAQGIIMKVNKQAYALLAYKDGEVIGKYFKDIVKNKDIEKMMEDCEAIKERISFLDIAIALNSGEELPCNITITPLQSKEKLLRGLLVVGEDIRVTKSLKEEISRNKLINEKLQNSEMLFRKILEIAPIAIILVSRKTGKIVYLNVQAAKLFEDQVCKIIGSHVSEYFINAEDVKYLAQNFYDNRKVSKSEMELKKKGGSSFIGLITLIPSIYQEEEVALTCVVDMSEQKKTEETLKQNNEFIRRLNKELMDMNHNLVNKSIKDGLTNLYNHQYMNEILELKLQEVVQKNKPLCLMMLDIDHFKKVNDKYGHQNGDKVLAVVADLIIKNTRTTDYIGRYGGEEFIAILPDIEGKEAVLIAERIRLSIQNYNFGIKNLKVTISIGVTQYEGELPNALINKADMLLYQAKHNGRNRIEDMLIEEGLS